MLNCVKRMKFEFDIGQEEKHNVRFIYSKIWGTRSIKVDNQIVKRRILPFFVNFSGIILIVVFIYFQFLQWPNYQANPFEIYFLVLLFLGFIEGVIARLPMTVIVGEKEQIFSFFSVTSTILFWKDTNLFVSCFHANSFRIFINRKGKWRFTS